MLDERVFFYTRGESLMNFGDYLSALLAEEILLAPIYQADVFRLVGSVISNEIIRSDLSQVFLDDAVIAYWGCGARDGEAIESDLRRHCVFFGVRGPLTKKILGLPDETPIGDPGFLTPLAYPQPRPSERAMGRMACMPHFSQLETAEQLCATAGADIVISPAVKSIEDLKCIIDEIVSVDFLLTASLHGAILACAYGKPFALWDNGYIDIPFKWDDFAASIGVEAKFFSTTHNCREWYAEIESKIQRPRLLDILGCCPFAVRPSSFLSAAVIDFNIERTEIGGFSSRIDDFFIERDEVRGIISSRAFKYRNNGRDEKRLGAYFARSQMGNEVADIANDLNNLLIRLNLKSKAANFYIENSSLSFSSGQLGVDFLRDGWTVPNDIAPWSLPPVAEIHVPFGIGWEKAKQITLNGYMFAPPVAPFHSRRRLVVWLNDVKVWDGIIVNEEEGEVALFQINFELPFQVRCADGPLIIKFASDPFRSPKDLGLSDDDRPIGIALLNLEFVSEADSNCVPQVGG